MRMRIATLSLLTIACLMLAVASAMADTLYDNGPPNGTTDAWTINFGFSVSDSFTQLPGNKVGQFWIVDWNASRTDVLTTVDMAIGTTSFGTDVLNTATYGVFASVFLGTNQYGYNLFLDEFQTGLHDLTGTNWITLSNACTTSGCSVSNPIYWDENSGVGCGGTGGGANCPSSAFENTIGSIPSEAFTLTGGPNPTTPEPSSVLLFGSGILGIAGLLRRRLNR